MKKVLIFGATSTIAQEVSKIYASQSAYLCLVGRNSQQLNIQRDDLLVRGATGVGIFVSDLNLLSNHSILINDIITTMVNIDVVLFSHGILGNHQKALIDQTEFLEVINTNFISHASLLLVLTEKLKSQKNSAIIAVISSVAGERGRQSNFIYGSAMAAKTTLVDGLRNSLFSDNIHVMTIKLGFVDTAMTKEFKKGFLWAKAPVIAKNIIEAIDLKKNSVYLPHFWSLIMLIIRWIPDFIFKRLHL